MRNSTMVARLASRGAATVCAAVHASHSHELSRFHGGEGGSHVAAFSVPVTSTDTQMGRAAPMIVSAHTSGGSGIFRPTRTNLFLPPQFARAAAAAGLVLGQAFMSAYVREKRRAAEAEAEENDGDGGLSSHEGGAGGARPMSALEAIQILGVDRANPALLVQFAPDKVREAAVTPPVLTLAKDRQVARENFEKMFKLATSHQNDFLAGKVSAAFRICVDPGWDDTLLHTPSDGADVGRSDGGFSCGDAMSGKGRGEK